MNAFFTFFFFVSCPTGPYFFSYYIPFFSTCFFFSPSVLQFPTSQFIQVSQKHIYYSLSHRVFPLSLVLSFHRLLSFSLSFFFLFFFFFFATISTINSAYFPHSTVFFLQYLPSQNLLTNFFLQKFLYPLTFFLYFLCPGPSPRHNTRRLVGTQGYITLGLIVYQLLWIQWYMCPLDPYIMGAWMLKNPPRFHITKSKSLYFGCGHI